MPSISTNHYVPHGTWNVTHYRNEKDPETLFSLFLTSRGDDAIHVCGLTAADLDQLSQAISAARQDADVSSRDEPFPDVLPRDCAGLPL